MTLDTVYPIINDCLPEIFCIEDYEGRIKKCVDIINTPHAYSALAVIYDDYRILSKESDILIEALLASIENIVDEKELREHPFVIDVYKHITDICSICQFEFYSLNIRSIPFDYVVSLTSYTQKIEILGFSIGDTKDKALEMLDRWKVSYKESGTEIEIHNSIETRFPKFWYRLNVYIEDNVVKSFLLQKRNAQYDLEDNRKDVGGYWGVLGQICNSFNKGKYKLLKCDVENVSELYCTHYDAIIVDHTRWETNIFIKSVSNYLKEKPVWWDGYGKAIKYLLMFTIPFLIGMCTYYRINSLEDKAVDVECVYICTSTYANNYHGSPYCDDLDNCEDYIDEIPVNKAKETGMTPCSKCYK